MKPIIIAAISLAAFKANVQADLAAGRRQFEANRSAQIQALTLSSPELATIKPSKR